MPRQTTRLLIRSDDERIFTGTAGAIGLAVGVDPLVVRLGFFVTTLGSGAGFVLYFMFFLLSRPARPGETVARREESARHTVGVLAIALGVLVLVHSLGGGVPEGLFIPVALVTVGSTIVWARLGESDRARLARDPIRTITAGRAVKIRFVIGGIFFLAGVASFLLGSSAIASARSVALAMLATVVGLAVLVGPYLYRSGRELSDERRERIRSEERAELSAHLHDSVLHTLALIQRSEGLPEVVSLARRQERELRAWMQGKGRPGDTGLLSDVLDEMVSRVESEHRVSIESVVVGDVSVDDRMYAMLGAVQESLVNAARHSGERRVSVFVEHDDEMTSAFIRDQGKGFDRARVPNDRQGLTESIEGRMRRAGGTAIVRTAPGEGTEVELKLPGAQK